MDGAEKTGKINSKELMSIACDSVASGEARYFVEVEIELPEVKTIVEATVTAA